MSNAKQVREMLKEHGISEEEYAKIVKKSGMSKEDYDDLALTYNAPKGITWKEVAKRYQEMHPDINLEEFLDRMMMKWEDEEFEDIQAFAKEIEEGIKEYRSPQVNQTYIDEQDNNIFRHDGATWTVKYNGIEKTIKHTKGMDYIAFLIRHQEQKIHSMELYQMMSGIVPDVDKRLSKASPERIESDEGLHVDGKDAFELVDQKDIDSVKNTIKQLEDEHPQAMMENDSVRENEISIKLDKLNDYLSKCTYKGKIRTASDATERMRVSIYMAIKTAKNNIKKHHKELFNHLNKFITTGTSISYSPDSPVSWFQDR
jgi:hypothetical protein